MAYKFRLPDIGEGVEEGEIVQWLVSLGDEVKEEQPIVEVMTDKATVVITSPVSGIVSYIGAKQGSVVKTGEVIIEFEEKDATIAPKIESATDKKIEAAIPVQQIPSSESIKPSEEVSQVKKSKTVDIFSPPEDLGDTYSLEDKAVSKIDEPIKALPRTRKLAKERGIDLHSVTGTGKNGRITDEDLMREISEAGVLQADGITLARALPYLDLDKEIEKQRSGIGVEKPLESAVTKIIKLEGIRKPLVGLRKKIAENMEISHHYIPRAVHMDEWDMTELVRTYENAKKIAQKKFIKLSYLAFFMKASAIALREFPDVNACFDEADRSIIEMDNVNIGFAVDTPSGLIVPILKRVDTKTILEIASEIDELAKEAREGRIKVENLREGSFTITNIGSIGGMISVPVIYHPQAAILATHSITPRPVVREGQIVIRQIMYISLAFDHRIIDGARAARFSSRIRELLEEPGAMLLGLK